MFWVMSTQLGSGRGRENRSYTGCILKVDRTDLLIDGMRGMKGVMYDSQILA